MVANIVYSDVDSMYLVVGALYLIIHDLHPFVDPLYLVVNASHLVADVLDSVINSVSGLQTFCSGHSGFFLSQFVESLQRIFNIGSSYQLLQKSL